MEILQTFALVLCAIVCFILIFMILLQSGKSGSMGIFGGGSANTAFGASTMDVVTKFTWILTVAFFATALLAAVAFAEGTPNILEEPVESIAPSGNEKADASRNKEEEDATIKKENQAPE